MAKKSTKKKQEEERNQRLYEGGQAIASAAAKEIARRQQEGFNKRLKEAGIQGNYSYNDPIARTAVQEIEKRKKLSSFLTQQEEKKRTQSMQKTQAWKKFNQDATAAGHPELAYAAKMISDSKGTTQEKKEKLTSFINTLVPKTTKAEKQEEQKAAQPGQPQESFLDWSRKQNLESRAEELEQEFRQRQEERKSQKTGRMTIGEYNEYLKSLQKDVDAGVYNEGDDVYLMTDSGLERNKENYTVNAQNAEKRAEGLRTEFEENRANWSPESNWAGIFDMIEGWDAQNEETILRGHYTPQEQANAERTLRNQQETREDRRNEMLQRAEVFFDTFDQDMWLRDWEDESTREQLREIMYDRIMPESYEERVQKMTPAQKQQFDAAFDTMIAEATGTNLRWENVEPEYDELNTQAEAYRSKIGDLEAEQKRRDTLGRLGNLASEYETSTENAISPEYDPSLVKTRTFLPDEWHDTAYEEPEGTNTDKAYFYANNVPEDLATVDPNMMNKYYFIAADPEILREFNILYRKDNGRRGYKSNLADMYLEALEPYLNYCMSHYQDNWFREIAEEPVIGPIARVMSYPLNLVGGAVGTLGTVGAALGVESAKDPNSAWYLTTKMVQTTRDQQNENFDQWATDTFGNWAKGKGKFLANVVDSIGDNLYAARVAGGLSGGKYERTKNFIQGIMSMEATSHTMLRKLESGTDPTEAAVYAVADGVIEWITEEKSIDRWLKPDVKSMLGDRKALMSFIGKAMLAEGSEEINADILNMGVDTIMSAVNGHETEIKKRFNDLVAGGMKPKEASRKVLLEKVEQTLESGLAGSLSGGFMAGGRYVGTAFTQRGTGKILNTNKNDAGQTGTQQIVDVAMETDDNSMAHQQAEQIQAKVENGEKITDREAGRLAQTLQAEAYETLERAQKGEDVAPEQVEKSLGVLNAVAEITGEKAADNKAEDYTSAQLATEAEIRQAEGNQTGEADEIIHDGKFGKVVALVNERITDESGKTTTTQKYRITVDGAEKTVDASEFRTTNPQTAAVIRERQVNPGLYSVGYTNTLLQEINKGVSESANVLRAAAQSIRYAAYTGMEMPKTDLNTETAQRLYDYSRGEFEARRQSETSEENRNAKGRGNGRVTFKGAVYGTNEYTEQTRSLSKNQRNLMGAWAEVARRAGIELTFVDNEDIAQRQAEDKAFFKGTPDTMYGSENRSGILLNIEGANYTYDAEQGKSVPNGQRHDIGVAFGHETIHWLQRNSVNGYNNLASYVLNQQRQTLGRAGLNNRLNTIMQRRGVDLYGAISELVADSCDQILANEDVIRHIQETDKGLYSEIRGFVKNLVARVKNAIGNMIGSMSQDAQTMLGADMKKLAELWNIAYDEATEKRTQEKKTEKKAEQKEAAEDETKNSIADEDTRRSLQGRAAEHIRMNAQARNLIYQKYGIGEDDIMFGIEFLEDGRVDWAAHDENEKKLIRKISKADLAELFKLSQDSEKWRQTWNENAELDTADYYENAAQLDKGLEYKPVEKWAARVKRFGPYTALDMEAYADLDAEYEQAVRSGDWAKAEQMLLDKYQKMEKDGLIGYNANYFHNGDHAEIARAIKTGSPEAIRQAAEEMALKVPDNAILIPMPPHSGTVTDSTDTMILAKAIAEITGSPVATALESDEHISRNKAKTEGIRGVNAESMGFRVSSNYRFGMIRNGKWVFVDGFSTIPDSKMPIFIDNVVGGGVTAQAAHDAVGRGITLAYAQSSRSKIRGAKYLSVTYDAEGKLIPLSQRMDPDNPSWKYSVAELPDGTKYLNLDTEQEIFDNATIDQYPRIVEQYITEKYRGKIIGETNRAYVDRKSAKEYAHPVKRNMNADTYSAKARASTELDNLMNVAVFKQHVEDDGRHPEAVRGWDQYSAIIRVPGTGRFYEGTINIEKVAKGDRFHDMTQIKDVTSEMQGRNASLNTGDIFSDNISQETENRNTRYSSAEIDEQEQRLWNELDTARSEQNQLQEQYRALTQSEELAALQEKVSAAETREERRAAMAEYKAWEEANQIVELKDRMYEAEQRRKTAQKQLDEYIEQRDERLEQEEIRKSGKTEAEWRRDQAVKHFGYTTSFVEAGYMLPNGKMLNFSGEYGKHTGHRYEDHRSIGFVYATKQSTDAMVAFMKDGNIRVMAEAPGIDMVQEPTADQYAQIRNMARRMAGEEYFIVEFTDENGNIRDNIEYDGRISPDRVVNDIKNYYRTGEAARPSVISQFHYSAAEMEAIGEDVTMPALDVSRTLYFTGTEDEIAQGESVMQKRAEEMKSIIEAKDFTALLMKNKPYGRYEILHPSTRPGVRFQLTYYGPDGIPSMHENYGRTDTENPVKETIHSMEDLYRHYVDESLGHDLEMNVLRDGGPTQYSQMEESADVNAWLAGQSISSFRTEDERAMWQAWKDLRLSMQLSMHKQLGYQQKIKQMEGRENLTPDEKRELETLKKRLELEKAKREQLEDQMMKITSDDGWAAVMRRSNMVISDFVAGRTQEQVQAAIDTMTNEIQEAEKTIAQQEKELRKMAESSAVKTVRRILGARGLTKTADTMRGEYNTAMSREELENRMAEIVIKQANGEDVTADVEALAEDVITNQLGYGNEVAQETLSELRGMTIEIGPGQQTELKANHSSLKEIRRRTRGSGIKFVYGTTSTLDTDQEELYQKVPALRGQLDNEKNSLENFVGFVENMLGMRTQNGMDAGIDRTEVEAFIRAMSNVLMNEDVGGLSGNRILAKIQEEAGRIGKALEAVRGVQQELVNVRATGAKAQSWASVLKQDMDTAMDYYNKMARLAAQNERKKVKEVLIQQLKNENTRKLIEQQRKYEELMKNDRRARELAEDNMIARSQITTVAKRIRNRLLAETDQKNVQEEAKPLARMVLNMLVDHDTAGWRRVMLIANKKQLMDTALRLQKMNAANDPFEADRDLDWLVIKAPNSADNDTSIRDKVMQDLMNIESGLLEYHNAEGQRNVTLQDRYNALNKIQDALSEIWDVIQARGEAFINGQRWQVYELAEQMEADMRNSRFKGERTGAVGKAMNTFWKAVGYGNLTPEYFIKNLKNRTMTLLHSGMQDAEHRSGLEALRAKMRIAQIAEETGYGTWDGQEKHTIKVRGGKTIEITTEQLMALYATWTREKNALRPEDTAHLLHGGFVLSKNDQGGLYSRQKTEQRPIRMSAEDLEALEGYLTPEQIRYVDAIVEYMSNDLAKLGNEASVRAYGIKKFTEQYYFPIKSWGGVLNKSSASGTSSMNDNRAMRQSFTKRITANANNAIEISDFTPTAMKHIVGMITFNTVGPAVENMNKVLNQQLEYGTKTEEEDDTYKRNMRASFVEHYGQMAYDYLVQFMKDVNGGVTREQNAFDKLLSVFKKNAVAGSLSVAAQQPLSYIRAATLISPKYLAAAISPAYWHGSYQEMMQHSGLAVIKDMGRFDMNFGRSMQDYITPEGKQSFGKKAWTKVGDAATSLPQKMDAMTWTRMWTACKLEQHAAHPELDMRSEELMKLTAQRFNELMRRTQVYDSVMVKSQNMRSTHWYSKTLTSFMAEPTLSLNVLSDAWQNIHEKGGKANAVKALATFLLSAAAQAGAKAFFGAGRSPDKKKNREENFMNKFGFNLLNEANPLSLIPGYSQIMDVLINGELNDDAMGMIGKAVEVWDKIFALATGKTGNKGLYRDLEDSVGQLLQLTTKIPAKNFMRDFRAMVNWFSNGSAQGLTGDTYADRPTNPNVLKYQFIDTLMSKDLIGLINQRLGDAGYGTANKDYYQRIFNAQKAGDTKAAEEMSDYAVTALIKAEDPEKTLRTALNSLAKSDDSMTGEEKARYMIDAGSSDKTSSDYVMSQLKDGKIKAEEARKLMKEIYPDKSDDEIWWKVDRCQYQAETGAEKAPSSNSYYYRLDDAIRLNKSDGIKEAVKTLTDHGVSKKRIKDKLSDYRQEYLSATGAEKTKLRDALTKAYKAVGLTAEEAIKIIDSWKKTTKK